MEMPIQIPLQGRTDCPAVSTFRVCPSCRESSTVSSELMPALPGATGILLCTHIRSLSKVDHSAPQGTPRTCSRLLPGSARLCQSCITVYPSVQACFRPLPFIGVDSLIKPNTPDSVSGSTSREPNQWQSSGVRGPGRRESQYKSVLSKPETLLGPLRRVKDAPWEWSIGWPLSISSQNCL